MSSNDEMGKKNTGKKSKKWYIIFLISLLLGLFFIILGFLKSYSIGTDHSFLVMTAIIGWTFMGIAMFIGELLSQDILK